MGCGIHVLIPALITPSLPCSPVAEPGAGRSCSESKDFTRIHNRPANVGLAKGHSWSGRACFNAEPKHKAQRLHLAHAVQHNACRSCITNLQDPRGLPRESTAFWLGFLVWKGCR